MGYEAELERSQIRTYGGELIPRYGLPPGSQTLRLHKGKLDRLKKTTRDERKDEQKRG